MKNEGATISKGVKDRTDQMVVDDGQIVRDSDQINQKDTIVQVQKKPENENDDGDSLEEVESPQQPVTVAQKKDA